MGWCRFKNPIVHASIATFCLNCHAGPGPSTVLCARVPCMQPTLRVRESQCLEFSAPRRWRALRAVWAVLRQAVSCLRHDGVYTRTDNHRPNNMKKYYVHTDQTPAISGSRIDSRRPPTPPFRVPGLGQCWMSHRIASHQIL